jgi:hypothetical protein
VNYTRCTRLLPALSDIDFMLKITHGENENCTVIY